VGEFGAEARARPRDDRSRSGVVAGHVRAPID
jgi:hypothetical protein